MTVRIRGLPARNRSLAMTTAFAGTPSFTRASPAQLGRPSLHAPPLSARAAANHKPVVHPSAVAQGPSTTPSPRSSCAAGGGQPVRLLAADRRARVQVELLRITCEETFLPRQQRRPLHGIFAAKHGEVECSCLRPSADRSSCFEIPCLVSGWIYGLGCFFFVHLISFRVITR